MTPPLAHVPEAIPPSTPPAPPERPPFWGYYDLAVFLGLGLPLLAFSALLVRLAVAPFTRHPNLGALSLAVQFLWYALWLGGLAVLFHFRYNRAFWSSLAWTAPSSGLWRPFFAGPILALLTGWLGLLLRAPQIELAPLRSLLSGRASLFLLVIAVAVLGPLCEELVFRGFLLPLLARTFGASAGILSTALLFALLHGPEYQWSWRHVLLIFLAGSLFGFVRWRTGSTLASALMHATYNFTFVAALVVQSGPFPQTW